MISEIVVESPEDGQLTVAFRYVGAVRIEDLQAALAEALREAGAVEPAMLDARAIADGPFVAKAGPR